MLRPLRSKPVGLREARCFWRVPYHWFSDTDTHCSHLGRFRNWVTFPEILSELVWDVG